MKNLVKIFILLLAGFPLPLGAQTRPAVGVGRFTVSGPADSQFLGSAAQDAVVGALMQQGTPAHALQEVLDPDQLSFPKKARKGETLLVAGRILVVGQTYRVRLKWVDALEKSGEDYLQVSHLDDLLPALEKYAQEKLPSPVLTSAATPATAVPESRDGSPTKKSEPEKKAVFEAAQASKPSKAAPKDVHKKVAEPAKPKNLRDYDYISERLPFEVRGLAFGDVNGDGKNEVLMTSQNKLSLFSFESGRLELLSEYSGGPLDYFVKVHLWPASRGAAPLVVLTNLRGDQAKGKILKYQQGKFIPVIENIPFKMRVLERNGESHLLGSPYSASSDRARLNIFRLEMAGSKLKPVEKLDLPGDTDLYNYHWVTLSVGDHQEAVAAMSPSGKLRLYERKDREFKKAIVSKESYGGSGNYVPVEVKDTFKEVVADYVGIPPGVQRVQRGGRSEVLVVKNESLVKNIIGRVPVISDGQLISLAIDEMGFVETWTSKKIDGSIQDYLVTTTDGNSRLMVAVRLRDPGLFGEMGRNDSVLLMYNLN
jgi:hypothetical protein